MGRIWTARGKLRGVLGRGNMRKGAEVEMFRTLSESIDSLA